MKKLLNNSLIRFLDIIISFIGLVIVIPVLIPICICLAISLRRWPIFKQKRIGKTDSVSYYFSMYKLRTMRVNGDHSTITRLGYLLRKLSIDELPQLINVLNGEMSLVGPRPGLRIISHHRLTVKPGITGMAQINGRSSLTEQQSLFYDLKWVSRKSIYLYLQILFKTPISVMRVRNSV